MRLINADALKIDYGFTWSDITPTHNELCKLIDRQPTIDAAPVVHGEWIVQTANYDPRETWIKCSICNYPTTKSWGETKFCPNCGAKMVSVPRCLGGGADNG